MFIKKASIKNFGNVKDQELNFSEGINMFCGENGEGKSTVLRVLNLLIFNQSVSTIGDYISWGKEEEGFDISTEFSHLQVDYRIEYQYSKKKANKVLTNLTTQEVLENSAITEYLNNLFDMKRALASIVSFENSIDIISTSPAERREYLKGIYDLNFKPQLKTIEEELANAKTSILSYQQEITFLESQEFNKLTLVRKPFSEELFEEKLKKEQLLRDAIFLLKQQEKEKEQLEEQLKLKEREFFKVKSQKDSIEENGKTLELDKTLLEEKVKNFGIFSSVDLEESKKEESKYLLNEQKELELEQKDLTQKLENEKEPQVDLLLDTYETKLGMNASELLALIAQDTKSLSPIKSGVCPVCGKPIDKSHLVKIEKDIKENQEKLDSVSKERSKVKNKISEQQIDLDTYNENKRKTERLLFRAENKLSQISMQVQNLDDSTQNKIDAAKNRFDRDLHSLKEKLSSIINKIESNQLELQLNLKELHLIDIKIEELENSLKLRTSNSTKIETQTQELKEVLDQLENYKMVLSSNEEKKKINALTVKKEIERDEKVKIIKASLELSFETESITILARSILSKDLPSFIISRMITSLKVYVNEFLAKVYPKFNLDIVENNNSLKVLYGPLRKDVRIASGFEQQIFSFAWKYALGKIQNYGLLILDEVDSAASAKNSEKLYNTLAKMGDYFQQVFVVSHKPEILELLSNDYHATVYQVENGIYSLV